MTRSFFRLRWTQALLCAGLLIGVAWGTAVHAKDLASPAEVKAAFLFRFTGYIEWPRPSDPTTPFIIAVLGGDDVADSLRVVLARHAVQGRPAAVRNIGSLYELGDASMLYVGPAYVGSLAAVVRQTRSQPMLIVSDREGGLEDGSMINFVLVDRRVRFEISLDAARASGLKVGPGLLAVAINVRGGPRSEVHCPAHSNRVMPSACTLQVARR